MWLRSRRKLVGDDDAGGDTVLLGMAAFLGGRRYREVPAEPTGTADVLTQVFFEGVEDLPCLYRASCRGSPLRLHAATAEAYQGYMLRTPADPTNTKLASAHARHP
jgi:hypothetical protein